MRAVYERISEVLVSFYGDLRFAVAVAVAIAACDDRTSEIVTGLNMEMASVVIDGSQILVMEVGLSGGSRFTKGVVVFNGDG